ncbi:steroid 3-ketoacyl-CoA thiolase [Microbacterium sp. YY-03]|uniref:steroid 3-ketoacyl-CoA thiolase n=1 Tax=Microbacterium sp. YY-03 TaxID=3421636 RepID=UPI003D182AE7
MSRPVIIDAIRSPYGKRGGQLSGVHAVDLLSTIQKAALDRVGLAPDEIDEVIGGCVTQAGEQSNNIARFAWLNAGFPTAIGGTTIDAQCGSGQQAVHLVAAQIAAGMTEVGLACGVEVMSRVPLQSNLADGQFGYPRPPAWSVNLPAQYEGADRIAARRGFTREQLDEFGVRSHQRAAAAWEAGYFDRQVVPVTLEDGTVVSRDGGLRESSIEGLSGLKTIREGGFHTAGTSSQLSDGATAAILMSEVRANAAGLQPRGYILAQCLVGGEPEYLLDGPVQAAERLLQQSGLSIDDIDIFEVNEAFAAVPMSVAKVHGIDHDRLNVNGGAIALGHPVGSTGIRLIANVLDELERRGGRYGMILTCAGGAMAAGTLIERAR